MYLNLNLHPQWYMGRKIQNVDPINYFNKDFLNVLQCIQFKKDIIDALLNYGNVDTVKIHSTYAKNITFFNKEDVKAFLNIFSDNHLLLIEHYFEYNKCMAYTYYDGKLNGKFKAGIEFCTYLLFNFINNELNGQLYYNTDELTTKCTYTNGKLNGKYEMFDPFSNNLILTRNYVDGKQEGTFIS